MSLSAFAAMPRRKTEGPATMPQNPKAISRALVASHRASSGMGGMFSRLNDRVLNNAIPQSKEWQNCPVRCDAQCNAMTWRYMWGGHDPASPTCEMIINYHNMVFGMMIGVSYFAFYIMRSRT